MFHDLFVDTASDYWKTIRGNYRRSVKKIAAWTNQKSGSGQQNCKKPRTYAYSAELSFLDDVFNLEECEDSMVTAAEVISDDQDSGKVKNITKFNFLNIRHIETDMHRLLILTYTIAYIFNTLAFSPQTI
jgi:hypothetical protein